MTNKLGDGNEEINRSKGLEDYANDWKLGKGEPYYIITDLFQIGDFNTEHTRNAGVQGVVEFDKDVSGDFLLIYPNKKYLKKYKTHGSYGNGIDTIKAEMNNRRFIMVSKKGLDKYKDKETQIDFINPKNGKKIEQDRWTKTLVPELSSIHNDLIIYDDNYGNFGLYHIVNGKLENKLAKLDKKIKKIKLINQMSVRSNIEIKTEDGCRYKIYSKDLYNTNTIDLHKIHKIPSLKDKFANGISKIFGKKNK